ncbi:MAG: BCCT family transporter [Spirochaetaceae bacterium]|nr:MAG: BCCT family transporter [Spirochaetaceae bacterium]
MSESKRTTGRRDPVFIISLILVITLVVVGFVWPERLDHWTRSAHGAVIEHVGFSYLLAAFAFLVFCVYMAFSRYGTIRLGNDEEKPQYGYFAWFSMLFAAGMGIGLIFWGVAEPLTHLAAPPEYLEAGSGEAAAFAMRQSFFHWGIHPWAIYLVMSLSIAYFSFRRGMPPLISSCFYPLIGDRIYGWPGKAIDILAVFATVFGVATSLGLGALQIGGGLNAVFGLAEGIGLTLTIIAVVTVLYLISSMTGLDKGIQILSKTNVLVALALMTFVLVVGPTSYIFSIFTDTLGQYGTQLISLSLASSPFEGAAWTQDWTIFYWAWWISWSPFVGLFVASISRGRTIREFILGALLVPAGLTFLWFSVFGGAGLHLQLHQGASVAQSALADASGALFEVLAAYPLASVTSLLSIVLLSVFFITSADSATFVIAMMTSRGSFSPPAIKKIGWGLIQSSAAAVLLVSGGLEALQRMAILAALPFMFVMLFMMRGLLKALRYEFRYERPSGLKNRI